MPETRRQAVVTPPQPLRSPPEPVTSPPEPVKPLPDPVKPLLRKAVGDVLRRTRIRQGRTLADVARAARVSLPYLSELERGRKDASSELLAAVCEGLRITLSQLVAEVSRELLGPRTPQASVVSLAVHRALTAGLPRRAQRRRSRRRIAGAVPAVAGTTPLRLVA